MLNHVAGHRARGRILQKIGSDVMAEGRGLPYASPGDDHF